MDITYEIQQNMNCGEKENYFICDESNLNNYEVEESIEWFVLKIKMEGDKSKNRGSGFVTNHMGFKSTTITNKRVYDTTDYVRIIKTKKLPFTFLCEIFIINVL